MKYMIKDHTILEIYNKQIKFNHNIHKVLEINRQMIVLLFNYFEKDRSVDMSKQPLNNIYAISEKGDIIWNIRDFMPEDYCYTGISIDDNGNLVANTFIGIAQIIDATNKKLVDRKVTK